ncbi:MAG TPA: hypothetical protein VF892_11090 [Pseudonocardiaceae bacterium]
MQIVFLVVFVSAAVAIVARRRVLQKRQVLNPPINVLAFGGNSSGKTIMLASLFRTLGLGGASGVQLETDRDSTDILVRWAANIESHAVDLPPATLLGDMTDFHFTFRVTGTDGVVGRPCRVNYIDYPGELTDIFNVQPHQHEPAARFRKAFDECDILMGVLDGSRILALLDEKPDDTIVPELNKMFHALASTERKTIHLILTKWDKLLERDHSLTHVVRRLALLPAYRQFISNPGRGTIRLIPVSSFGVNGYLTEDDKGLARKTVDTRIYWEPYNVAVPLAWSLQDVLAVNWTSTQSEAGQAQRRRHLVRQFSTFFVSAAWLLGLIHVGFPALGGLMSVEFSLARDGGTLLRQLGEQPQTLRSRLRRREQHDLLTVLEYLRSVAVDGLSCDLSTSRVQP